MPADDRGEQRPILARVLKRLRESRGLQVGEVAARAGIPRRTYEDFEAGRRKLRMDRLALFAEVLDVDLYAIFVAMELASPELAVRCADNKMVTIALMHLQDFNAETGNAILQLDPQTISSTFDSAFGALKDIAVRRAGFTKGWRDRAFGPRPPRGRSGGRGRRR